MEFKSNNRRSDRNKVTVPERHPAAGAPFVPTPSAPHTLASNDSTPPKDLAKDRETFGFDDIPVDDGNMEHVRFRDIFRAWANQTIKHSPLEDKVKNVTEKKGRLNELKNDLKWALQADLDEPVKPSLKPSKRQPTVTNVESQQAVDKALQAAANKSIDININLGSLPKLPKMKAPSPYAVFRRVKPVVFQKKAYIAFGIIALVTVGFFGTIALVKPGSSPKNSAANASNRTIEKPDYTTLLPNDKTVDTLGGWKRVSPPEKNPVFAYSDTINKIGVSVSQQPLPESFHPDVDDQLEKLAKSFSATNELDVDGTKVYLGNSAKGPQSIIFTKNDTLVLIKSQSKVSDDAWTDYIKSLK